MGKRTLRTLHFELVASAIRATWEELDRLPAGAYREGAREALQRVAVAFAEVFAARAEGFLKEKFLEGCGTHAHAHEGR